MVRPGVAGDSKGVYACPLASTAPTGWRRRGGVQGWFLAQTRTCWHGAAAHLARYWYGDLVPCTTEAAELTGQRQPLGPGPACTLGLCFSRIPWNINKTQIHHPPTPTCHKGLEMFSIQSIYPPTGESQEVGWLLPDLASWRFYNKMLLIGFAAS